ncbi:helix-turn-helix domain-containing protein [Coprococcus sp. AF21-14LB]|uniref:helix-turn-helix domain-containing protein n=1 Tax=Coprococcus sp. AF21-14LB TaxID=2292231 RepID=UPI000E4DBB13|nr:helix-turn-helix domain-containing protein [Coprococcus sp. AF21-14LB]QUO31842.1 helix-turn-helix domain-containing protein [Faecalicatena sp. Marseille-Q4148]RGS80548.1 helix-turn-helix domain-containing protein [Coprococcus sp. AF21-14LB]
MGIGKRIRDRRAELGMSSMELAEQIGVSKQTISGYELERTYPNPEKLSRILNVLQCDANYLYQDVIDLEVLKRERNGMTETEFELLRKYRLLNDHGKFVVESIANIEYDRMLEGLERSRAKKNQ